MVYGNGHRRNVAKTIGGGGGGAKSTMGIRSQVKESW
jgi:hypothetical protein